MLNCISKGLFYNKIIFFERVMSLDFKTCFLAIALILIGIILGVNFRNQIYVKYDIVRQKYENNKIKVITYALALIVGIIIGILIMLIFRLNSSSSLSGWVSGLGTWAAVVISLWLASGRRSKLKVNHGQTIEGKEYRKIDFIAYNLSDVSISLKFNGVKKPNDKTFQNNGGCELEVVKAGEFQQKSLSLEFIESNLEINDDYDGNIISGFSEPNGNLHCEIINWPKEMSKFKKMNLWKNDEN